METIIYIGLLSVIISFVVVVFYQILGSQGQGRDRIEADAEANFLMQKIVWAMVGATAINQPAVSATGTTLSLTKYNYSSNPIIFYQDSNNMLISRGGSASTTLNSARVTVNQLTFTHVAASGTIPEAVQVVLKVVSSDVQRTNIASTTLNNTLYLRQ